ncbi:MAG: methyltransferase domain-containing protein [Alphaproteobacteria bacterium]|nr:methyltransferase domain-containing protein [Alphaproteobacteria bacterium]
MSSHINSVWDNTKGMRVLGVGFTPPYLDKTCHNAERKIAAMPAAMGVLHWPDHKECMTILGDETALPFPDCFFDRVIIAHGLESTGNEKAMLREIWRVMAVGGKVISIVPNRISIWARSAKTPFGRGAPYTIHQVYNAYNDNMFSAKSASGALFSPPFLNKYLRIFAKPAKGIYKKLDDRNSKIYGKIIKTIGLCCHKIISFSKNIFKGFAGVLIVEAEKQNYSVHAVPAYKVKRKIMCETPVPSANQKQSTKHS